MNVKPKMIITVGMSGSGKTTWAEQFRQDQIKKSGKYEWMIICRDNVRFDHLGYGDWSKYKQTKAKEAAVTDICEQLWDFAKCKNMNVIIADTNLNETYRNNWIKRGEDAGYEVEVKPFPITLEESWKRNCHRGGFAVDRETLYKQWKNWNKFRGRKVYIADESKPKAILVDVDGTIAQMYNRSPFEWSKVGQDKPRQFIIDLIKAYIDNCFYEDEVIFLSGRDGICRHETLTWIAYHFAYAPHNIHLLMRQQGDMRKDTIVKEEIFWNNIADHYNVVAAFDDRPCVCRMWRDIGIPNVIAVADPHLEF